MVVETCKKIPIEIAFNSSLYTIISEIFEDNQLPKGVILANKKRKDRMVTSGYFALIKKKERRSGRKERRRKHTEESKKRQKITTKRKKKTIKDAEADCNANNNTDHNTVKARLQIKRKGVIKKTKQRKKYEICNMEQSKTHNLKIAELIDLHTREHRENPNNEQHNTQVITTTTEQ